MGRVLFEAPAKVDQIERVGIGRLPGHRLVAKIRCRGRQAVPSLRFRPGYRPDGFQPSRLF